MQQNRCGGGGREGGRSLRGGGGGRGLLDARGTVGEGGADVTDTG